MDAGIGDKLHVATGDTGPEELSDLTERPIRARYPAEQTSNLGKREQICRTSGAKLHSNILGSLLIPRQLVNISRTAATEEHPRGIEFNKLCVHRIDELLNTSCLGHFWCHPPDQPTPGGVDGVGVLHVPGV